MAPRTGCTAIGERVLIPALDGEYVPTADVVRPDGTVATHKKHSTLAELVAGGFVTPDEARTLTVFTAIRNPFDSLVSQYVKMRVKYAPLLDDPESFVHRDPAYLASMKQAASMSFQEWCAARYVVGRDPRRVRASAAWRSPVVWLARGWAGPRHMYAGFLRGARHVMRFESLQSDFDGVLRHLGLEPRPIPTWNITEEKGDYRSYYDDETRTLIAHVFAPDVRRFGYTF